MVVPYVRQNVVSHNLVGLWFGLGIDTRLPCVRVRPSVKTCN